MNGGTCDSAIGCICVDDWTGINCSIGMWFVLCLHQLHTMCKKKINFVM